MNDNLDALCDASKGGCGHFLTVHTRGMILWDRCLTPGCVCKKAVLPMRNPLKIGERFHTLGITNQQENKMTDVAVEKQVVTQEEVGKIEDVLPELLATPQAAEVKKVTLGKKATLLADAFIKIAKENSGVVTLEQAKEVEPKAPSDLAYYARLRGSEITTEKKREGGTKWVLMKE